MDLTRISCGKNAPDEIHVLIEVPAGSDPVKYEFDKETGALFVDRLLGTAMFYPANYGFIPCTLGGDGDPLDVLVVSHVRFQPGCVVPARPLGVLVMEDEKGMDEKIIAVPARGLNSPYDKAEDYNDLPEILLQQIGHFFERYKDLEKGKWVKLRNWDGVEEAKKLIREAIEREQQTSKAA